jgi:GNAT superfamily N-acetyltransferase
MTEFFRFVNLRNEPESSRVAVCWDFYRTVYKDAFPNPDESEDPDTWLPLLADDEPTKPRLHIIIAYDSGGEIAGGVTFEFYSRSKCWLATYIAVGPRFRRRGLARALMEQVVATIQQESGASRWTLLAEVEDPRTSG